MVPNSGPCIRILNLLNKSEPFQCVSQKSLNLMFRILSGWCITAPVKNGDSISYQNIDK